MTAMSYEKAGVNIAKGNEAVDRIKLLVERTFSPCVATKIGSFGALYDLGSLMREYEEPMLVQSMDGVGTKSIVARMMNKFDTLGIDLISACVNDIVVMGAKPITFLDYIASDKLDPCQIESIIQGMSEACVKEGISLIGGEMAEMPGTYNKGEIDLVGIVTGVVEKKMVITGEHIQEGDLVYGLASNGLHTNGYSLARKLCFEVAGLTIDCYSDDLGTTVGEALLKPHLNYQRPILGCLDAGILIKGMAHITGGGFTHNVPRILPKDLGVVLHDVKKWPVPPIFDVLKKLGNLSHDEMYTTFNMGIGLVIIIDKTNSRLLEQKLVEYPEHKLYCIGEVVQGKQHNLRVL